MRNGESGGIGKWQYFITMVCILFLLFVISSSAAAFLCMVIAGVSDPPYLVKIVLTGLIAFGVLYRMHFWPIKELNKAVGRLFFPKGNGGKSK